MKLALATSRLSRPRSTLFVAAALLAAAAQALAGCTVAGAAIGVAASAATKASEERGFSTSVSDDALYLEINRRLLDQDGDLFSAVKVQVHEGRVLLSGEVGTPESRMEAVRIAWQPDGIAEVINEMTVTGGDPNGWRDFWIIQKIDGKLLMDGDIRSINYSIESVDGVVYLIGIAQNEVELNRVIDHARDVQYVRRIVNYVRIKTQAASAE